MMIELNKDSFREIVLDSDKPVLVDFYAEWCGPCKMLMPVLETLSGEVDNKICKLNVDTYNDIASTYNVRNLPTVLIFQNGEIVERLVGVNQISTYKES